VHRAILSIDSLSGGSLGEDRIICRVLHADIAVAESAPADGDITAVVPRRM
jgi:hypothetical protein